MRARGRAVKGRYQITLDDLEWNLDGCLVLLVPGTPPDLEHARHLARRFPQRAWIAVELLCGPSDQKSLRPR